MLDHIGKVVSLDQANSQFRADWDVNGIIDEADIAQVTARSGATTVSNKTLNSNSGNPSCTSSLSNELVGFALRSG